MGDAARGYSWPPFAPGHTLSLKHGADSPARVQPIADELATWLAEHAPWTARPAFIGTAAAWCWAEARCRLVRAYLEEQPLVGADGDVLRAATYLERLETRAAGLRRDLGLDPQSLARLLTSLADLSATVGDDEGLAAVAREGRAIREARERQLAQGGDDA